MDVNGMTFSVGRAYADLVVLNEIVGRATTLGNREVDMLAQPVSSRGVPGHEADTESHAVPIGVEFGAALQYRESVNGHGAKEATWKARKKDS